jgi:hypothetical protein
LAKVVTKIVCFSHVLEMRKNEASCVGNDESKAVAVGE